LPYSISWAPKSSETSPIKDFITEVIKQRPAETLLLLNRRQDDKCNWNDLQHLNIPTIRLDEFTTFEMQKSFNKELIGVICMSDIADANLLSVAAMDLHRMRDARVIIWLQNITTNLNMYLNIIRDHSNNLRFINLLVMHSTSHDLNNSLEVFQLQPFPIPTLTQVIDLKDGELFPKFWKNFQNKTGFAVPGLYPPISFPSRDKKTGKKCFKGFMDKLIIEFTKKRNINLQMLPPQNKIRERNGYDREILEMTSKGKIDLSMHCRGWTADMENSNFVGLTRAFIAVPCGDVMGVGNIFRGFKNYFIIILCVYLAFSVIETLHAAATCRIFGRRYRFSWANLLINLNSFRWVLGLSINVHRNRRSMSLHQIIMIMSIFSMIVTCLFNANVSTFFTKRPTDNKITNFDELRESGVKIVFDRTFRDNVLENIRARRLKINENQAVFLSSKDRMELMFAQNTSFAFQTFIKVWETFDVYQKYYNRKTLCRHRALKLNDTFSIHGMLQNNSIYKNALNEFIDWSHDFGLSNHWSTEAIRSIPEFSTHGKENRQPTPLTFEDLKWVWKLIGLCYATAILVFIGELCLVYMQRSREPRLAFI
ncbi:hypothetical protein KR215_003696, partial [Drosophila sulfurigaster]